MYYKYYASRSDFVRASEGSPSCVETTGITHQHFLKTKFTGIGIHTDQVWRNFKMSNIDGVLDGKIIKIVDEQRLFLPCLR